MRETVTRAPRGPVTVSGSGAYRGVRSPGESTFDGRRDARSGVITLRLEGALVY
jgi:hypothetical protein